jgi:plasmid stabilization system protein ParE
LERLAERMTPEIYDGLWDAVDSLAELPERCALVPEPKLRAKRVRHLLYGWGRQVYRIIYQVRDERVEILTIRHGRRRPLGSPKDMEPAD